MIRKRFWEDLNKEIPNEKEEIELNKLSLYKNGLVKKSNKNNKEETRREPGIQ